MIRAAEARDIERILQLLRQVNDVHADIRPDLFIHGHTKYTAEDLAKLFSNADSPVFVITDDADRVLGYCFCMIQDDSNSRHLQPTKTLYIDDLCVEASERGKHLGSQLYDYVLDYARSIGCGHITLNVWEGNDKALSFYKSRGMTARKTTLEIKVPESI